MERFASLILILAALVAIVGFGTLLYLNPPRNPSESWETLSGFATDAATPLNVALGSVAVVLSFAVRRLDRPLLQIRVQSRVHRLDYDPAGPTPVGLDGADLQGRLIELLRHDGAPPCIDELITAGIYRGASDIHIQPLAGSIRILMRVQGELEEVASLVETFHESLIRRLKVLARLVTYQSREPQDGSFTVQSAYGEAEVRLSVLPTRYGEKAVLRLARSAGELRQVETLGMTDDQLTAFKDLLAEPQGLILLTGPTGSGKTTTIYSALHEIHRHRGRTINIATIEDPIEVGLPFASQTQVNRAQNLGFAAGLRAVLRQDPNVLLIGETRDPETAEIAVRAGLTGHLILTTLHADSTAGVFVRLIDTGIEPFLVASATLACVSQRLVRTLCAGCREPDRPDRRTAAELERRGLAVDPSDLRTSMGCALCQGTGLAERRAVYEMLRMTPELRELIASKVPTSVVHEEARKNGMSTLADSASLLLANGEISAAEALRVVA